MQEELRKTTEASGLTMDDIAGLSALTDEQLKHEMGLMNIRSGSSTLLQAVSLYRAVAQANVHVEAARKKLEASMQDLLAGTMAGASHSKTSTNSFSRTVVTEPLLPRECTFSSPDPGIEHMNKADSVMSQLSAMGPSGSLHNTDVNRTIDHYSSHHTNAAVSYQANASQEYLGSVGISNKPSPPLSWSRDQEHVPSLQGPGRFDVPQLNFSKQATPYNVNVLGEALASLQLRQQQEQRMQKLQQQVAEAPPSLVTDQLAMPSGPMSLPPQSSPWPSSNFDMPLLFSEIAQSQKAFDVTSMMNTSAPQMASLSYPAGSESLSADMMGSGIESLVLQQSLTEMQLSAWRQQQQRQIDEAMGLMQQQQQINETMSMMKAMSPMVTHQPYTMATAPVHHDDGGGGFNSAEYRPQDYRQRTLQQRSLPIQRHPPPPPRPTSVRVPLVPPPPPPPPMPHMQSSQQSISLQQRAILNAHSSNMCLADGKYNLPDHTASYRQPSSGQGLGSGQLPKPKSTAPLPPHAAPINPSLIKSSQEALAEGLITQGGQGNIFAPLQQFLMCRLCHVMCTSELSMNQHLVSKKHLSRATR